MPEDNKQKAPPKPERKSRLKRFIKPALALLAVAALLYLGSVFNVQDQLHRLLHRIQELGAVGYIIFVAVYILSAVFLIPGSILTLGAGAIYGVVGGTILISVSSTLGATAAFLVGRYAARGWVEKKISGNEKFKAVDDAVGREGWKIVGLTRLSPVFPFSLLNYAYGITKVKLRDYFLASWIGMLPGTLMYVYIGSLAKSLSAVAAGCEDCSRSPAEWAMYALGLAATVAVTVYVTRIARKALARRVPGEPIKS